jgi:membrane protease YdiL (CAAX protease family)
MPDLATGPETPPVLTTVVNRGRWWIHLLLLGAFPVVSGIASLGQHEERGPALTHTASGLVMVSGVNLFLFALLFALAWLASRASSEELLWRWRPGVWVVPLGLAYSVALRVAVAVAAVVVAMIVGIVLIATHTMTQQQLQEFFLANRANVVTVVDVGALRHNPLYFWLTLTVVSFGLGGLREELWRSGFLAGLAKLWPRWFGSRLGQIGAVAVAAVLFGLGHAVQGVGAIGLTALLGFGLGVIMVLHRSIWPAVLAHGAFDATSLALLPWATDMMHQLH